MNRHLQTTIVATTVLLGLASSMISVGAPPPSDTGKTPSNEQANAEVADDELPSAREARGRAKLLHETIHATLQVVHHKYYREDEGLPIPAFTLKSVFRELSDRRKVEIRWLAINAQAMNVNHNPKDEFEKNAAKALTSGQENFELAENGVYRHVGVITLTSECLKCHLPNRTSNKNRVAGLIISMPIVKK